MRESSVAADQKPRPKRQRIAWDEAGWTLICESAADLCLCHCNRSEQAARNNQSQKRFQYVSSTSNRRRISPDS